MTFVALWIPDWPTGAAANDLLSQLLAVAPRAALSPAKQLAWLDARGLDAGALVERARDALTEIGVTEVFSGIARVPCVAEIAAKVASRESQVARNVKPEPHHDAEHSSSRLATRDSRLFLAPLPLDVLDPPQKLLSLFAAVGLVTCGDLARLTRESVEVRFGRDGLTSWKLARAEDPRPIFSSRPRELPDASLDWTEFSTTDLEQLVFVLHSLLKTVCDAIALDGVGARTLTLTLTLENRTTIVQPVGAARATAQRTTWLRLMRRALERITLPDRVTGIAIQVDAVGAPAVKQGDLFDLGFASTHAAEAAVAQVMDLQHDAVVVMERYGHALPERRVKWEVEVQALSPEPGVRSETRVRRESRANLESPLDSGRTPGSGRTQGSDRTPGSGLTAQGLSLHPMLLPTPRAITVLTVMRRGFVVPTHYTDNTVPYPLTETLGPHCLSGDAWNGEGEREYHQGVRADGVVVLLYRDVTSAQWYLAGWWD